MTIQDCRVALVRDSTSKSPIKGPGEEEKNDRKRRQGEDEVEVG